MVNKITYKDGDPHRIVSFGKYSGFSCLEICRKDKDSRSWQAWICDKTKDDQLRADLHSAMILFIEERLNRYKGDKNVKT